MPDLHRHPLLPALAAALLCQTALVALLRPSISRAGAKTNLDQATKPGQDTPELLRLSRNLLRSSARQPADLTQLLAVPLPPPPQLTPPPPVRPARPQAPCPPTTPKATPPVPPKATAAKPAVGILPNLPGQALDLAQTMASGKQALPAEGASQAQVAIQRRQWWLTAQESRQLLQAWDQGKEDVTVPNDWPALPVGTQVRRVTRQSLGTLAAGDPHGRSLVNREQITLLWGSGPELWLLRFPWASGGLTSS
jgi:hypothetical protein